jgi:subtilisin family serine protease
MSNEGGDELSLLVPTAPLSPDVPQRREQLMRFAQQDLQIGDGATIVLPSVGGVLAPRMTKPADLEPLATIFSPETDAHVELLPMQAADTIELPPQGWPLEMLRADVPHSQDIRGRDTLIGVLDTGVLASHSEFAGKKIWFRDFTAGASATATDWGGHGTFVCSLAAGRSVSLAPKANLAVAAVVRTDENGAPRPDRIWALVRGLDWLLTEPFVPGRHGVDVICASLYIDRQYKRTIRMLRWLLSRAISEGGPLLVAAVGDDGGKPNLPAALAHAIGVGAIDWHDRVPPWSSRALRRCDKPELYAPGECVHGAWSDGDYRLLTGTSAAAPFAAGAAALCVDKHPTLRSNPVALRKRLLGLSRALPKRAGMPAALRVDLARF